MKLGAWLEDGETKVMLKSGTIKSLTFKASRFGANISKQQDIENSNEWELTELPDVGEVDLPEANWDDVAPPSPAASSSAASSSTPPSSGRGRGRP